MFKGKIFQIETWLIRLTWFCGIVSTLFIWVNFNSTRPILSGKSILINIVSVLVSMLIAESVYRIFYQNATPTSLIKSKKTRRLMITWVALLIFSFFYNVDEGFNKDHSRPNIILIIVDTLRADRLGSYGYSKETTPNIDKIAKQGVQFEQAYVQWASSLPSHSSIMTSLQPYLHGAFPNGNQLNPEVLTLAKILKAYGYTNGAFVTNRLVGNQYNFEIGFERFFDLANITYSNSTKTAWMHSLNLIKVIDKLKRNDIFTDLALSWIEDNKDDPIFLWLQLLYPHAPYEPPSKFLKKFEDSYAGIADGTLEQISLITKNALQLSVEDQDHYSALYDGEVAYSDYQIGRVINKLKELNILENSLIVITSDHGENLYEHSYEYGHYGVYDSSIRIPLIFSMPQKLSQHKKIKQIVQSIDMTPTILDLVDIEKPDQFQGKSLMPMMFDKEVNWESTAYSIMLQTRRNFFAIRSDDWKIMLTVLSDKSKKFELYHIPSDPNELNNRLDSEPVIADSLKNVLVSWIENNFEPIAIAYTPGLQLKKEFDKATEERLRSLGYIK